MKVVCASCAAVTAKVVIGGLHHAVDGEVPALGVRAVVVEEYSRLSPSASLAENSDDALMTCPARGGEVGRRHRRRVVRRNVDVEFLRPAEGDAVLDVHEQIVRCPVPAVKVVCASCAAVTAKVVLAACTTPLTVKWPLVGPALLS